MKNQAINLGRIGILLPIAAIFLFWIPLIGQLIGLAPIVLLLISHHKFSGLYGKDVIFKNILIGVIVSFVGSLIGGLIIGASAISALVGMGDPAAADISFGDLFSGVSILGVIIILAGMIIGVYFVFQALKTLAEETGVKYFKTAGLLYFIGAITMIIFGLGGLIAFVGWIFHIIAYFTIQTDKVAPQA